ncbi:MAG: YbjN domain-containing protein [Leptothrix ochracea]|uniref:YbjN domain-containing protein n=2 Tax=Leptothrix ochracea TaxID=735331 RepID=UPI0034E252FB
MTLLSRLRTLGLPLLASLALVQGAAAQNSTELITAADPEKILEVAKGFGSATLETDAQGDPKIVGRVEGTKYGLYFYGCKGGKQCTDIQFNAAWSEVKVSLDQLNGWNSTRRYGKAFLDRDGDPVLQMSVNLDHGVSRKNLEDTFDWWAKIVPEFRHKVLE